MISLQSLIMLAASALAATANAAQLIVSVPPSQLLPNPSTLPSSSHAVLLGSPGTQLDSLIRKDNTFVFTDLAPSSYLLTVHATGYAFPPLRVDVIPAPTGQSESSANITAWQTFRGNEWSHTGPVMGSAQDTLRIALPPIALKDYYTQRSGFSILSFLKSPMILMGLVSVAMIVGLPYIMDNCKSRSVPEHGDMATFCIRVADPSSSSSGPGDEGRVGTDAKQWSHFAGTSCRGQSTKLRPGRLDGREIYIHNSWWRQEEIVSVVKAKMKSISGNHILASLPSLDASRGSRYYQPYIMPQLNVKSH